MVTLQTLGAMKKKLNLKDLEVQSFITSFENKSEDTVKGGSVDIGCSALCTAVCPPAPIDTNNTTCCLDTKVIAICEGYYTLPGWVGCGGFK